MKTGWRVGQEAECGGADASGSLSNIDGTWALDFRSHMKQSSLLGCVVFVSIYATLYISIYV